MIVTRFAPSPNGPLHLGHAWSAIVAHDAARDAGGQFLVRIEDIDGPRSREEHAEGAIADLDWLGLNFDGPVIRQSQRRNAHEAALTTLRERGLLYPCTCTRAEVQAAATKVGPDGPIYPRTCRISGPVPDRPFAWRLDMAKAIAAVGPLSWHDERAGDITATPQIFGDVVLARKDAPGSYHLAVTCDDATDGITLVTRGVDLFAATHVHRLLQELLGLPVPRWLHHDVIVEPGGRKLAKRRGSPSLAEMRAAGQDGRHLARVLRAGDLPEGLAFSSHPDSQ